MYCHCIATGKIWAFYPQNFKYFIYHHWSWIKKYIKYFFLKCDISQKKKKKIDILLIKRNLLYYQNMIYNFCILLFWFQRNRKYFFGHKQDILWYFMSTVFCIYFIAKYVKECQKIEKDFKNISKNDKMI